MPNSDIIRSTHTGTLPVPALQPLPQAASTAHIIPSLKQSLVSIGVLCDNGCTAFFDKDQAVIKHGDNTIIQGRRTRNGLWTVLPSFQAIQHEMNSLVTKDGAKLHQRIQDHLQFLHAACFSPVQSTWLQAINNNNFITWPAVTAQNIAKFFKKSSATVKGHLDQVRQNIQSTKRRAENNKNTTATENNNITPSEDTQKTLVKNNKNTLVEETNQNITSDRKKNHEVYTTVIDTTDQTHSDLTGSFPHISSKGNKYLLVMYHYDTNGILVEPLKSRTGPEIFRAHKVLFARLLEQAEITLNLLRTSRTHPQMSSYAHLFGPFDYNKTPLAPPGTKVIIHEKSRQRGTWSPHGLDGWYVGPAMNHYRCFRIYVPSTGATRTADTVEFFPHHVPLPQTSSHDIIVQAADELIQALQQPHPATPYNPTPTELKALQELANIFQNSTAPRVKDKELPNTREATPPRVETEKEPSQGPAHTNNQSQTTPNAPKPQRQTRNSLNRQNFVEDLQVLTAESRVRQLELPVASPKVSLPKATKITQQRDINEHMKMDDLWHQINHIATITPLHPLIAEQRINGL